jgi:hypothetical protein
MFVAFGDDEVGVFEGGNGWRDGHLVEGEGHVG